MLVANAPHNNFKFKPQQILTQQNTSIHLISKTIYNPTSFSSFTPYTIKSNNNTFIFQNKSNPNNKNSQIPFEYINEIWQSLIEKETFNNYNYNSILSKQTDINAKMRTILVDWLISVHQQLRLKQNTLFLTINIIDRYISLKEILRTKFQLLGVTAMFIACKYEEIACPHISFFVEFTAKTFTKTEILEMENSVLSILKFELNYPSSVNFYEILALIYEFNNEEYKLGCFLLEVFLLDIKCNKYLQSEIALAVCFILLKLKGGNIVFENSNNSNENNGYLWGENIDKIKECAKEIYYYLENRDKITNRSVFDKYFNVL
jgi:cyclin B